jgi:hypothetical protein
MRNVRVRHAPRRVGPSLVFLPMGKRVLKHSRGHVRFDRTRILMPPTTSQVLWFSGYFCAWRAEAVDRRRILGRRSSASLRASSRSAWTPSLHGSSPRRRERGSPGTHPRPETVQEATTQAGGGQPPTTPRIPPGGGTTMRPRPRVTSSFQRGDSLRWCSCRWCSTFFAASACDAAF